jgi:hypothetical protein
MIVLEGLFHYPCLFFLLCLTVTSLVLLATELNFVKYETQNRPFCSYANIIQFNAVGNGYKTCQILLA